MARKFERLSPLLIPATQTFHLMPSVKFGPILVDGRQQRVQSSGPHWVAEQTFQLAKTREIQEFRAFVTKMNGGATEVIIPISDRRQAPWPSGTSEVSNLDSVTWQARTWNATWATQVIKVKVYAIAYEGATEMKVVIYRAGTLRRGQHFSITDATGRPRLYQISEPPRIEAGDPTVDANGNLVRTISFQPPLRARVGSGSVMDFDNPTCTMTLDKPDSGQITFEGWFQARPSLSLRESFGGI